MSVVLVLGTVACTTASESEVQALGAALGSLPLAAPKLPPNQLPPNQLPPRTLPKQPVQLCPSKPDLSITSVSVTNNGYKNYAYVCAQVKNSGQAAWSSNASQVNVRMSTDVSGGTSASASGFASLPVGASVAKCAWVKVPGLLRMGHDEPQWGECKATLNATAQFVFDPDIGSDGNTANDDCLSVNNKRTSQFNYMVECPW